MNIAARIEEIKFIFAQPIALSSFVTANDSMVVCPDEVGEATEDIDDHEIRPE